MAEQVAIITGAGGGIGRAIALELSRRGFELVLVGRTEATLREAAHGDALVVAADISRPESAESVVNQALARFGRIDALINNAGIAPVLTVEQTTPQRWREVIDINLSAAFYLCRAVWPSFKKQQSGVIVNISSLAAKDPFPGFAAYASAKAGLNTLGLSLAQEGRSIGVRVHTIAPGAVETPLLRTIVSPEQLSPDRTLAPEAVARVVGECADGKSGYHSGEVIWMNPGTPE